MVPSSLFNQSLELVDISPEVGLRLFRILAGDRYFSVHCQSVLRRCHVGAIADRSQFLGDATGLGL